MQNCGTCGHPKATHWATPEDMHCRLSGCSCSAFAGATEGPTGPDTEARTATIEIPDGYVLTVTLTPVAA